VLNKRRISNVLSPKNYVTEGVLAKQREQQKKNKNLADDISFVAQELSRQKRMPANTVE
jgi:hypothetical protein